MKFCPGNKLPSTRSAVLIALDGKSIFYILTVSALMILMLLAATGSLYAQDAERPVQQISLREAMRLALEKNFDIQARALDSESAYANIVGSYSIYDYVVNQSLNLTETNQRQINQFQGGLRHNQSLRTTLQRNFFTGAGVSVNLNMNRSGSNAITSTLNPQFGDTMTFSIDQPLLKGFGRLATERQIIVNRNNLKISDNAFEGQVITTLVDVQSRYWDLVAAHEALKVAQDSLELARQQLENNKVKVRVGTLPEIEIIQAEQQVALSESALLDAQVNILRAEDNLKRAIVMDDWKISLLPTDKLSDPHEEVFDFEKASRTAFDKRPEVRDLDLRIENNEVAIKYAKNQLKPGLNLQASYDLFSSGGTFTPTFFGQEPPAGLPLSFTETFTDIFSGTNRTWEVGFTFSYIFGNNNAKASLMSGEISKRQNELRRDQLRYNIEVEVRNAIRELEAAAKQLEARRKSLLYAQRQYEAEQLKFANGTSTNFQVLEFQNRLASARNQVIIAQVRYNKALIDFDSATGMLLEKNIITIQTTKEGITGASMGR